MKNLFVIFVLVLICWIVFSSVGLPSLPWHPPSFTVSDGIKAAHVIGEAFPMSDGGFLLQIFNYLRHFVG